MDSRVAVPIHERPREAKLAGIAGLVFVTLFVVGAVLLANAPTPEASDEAVSRFYGGGGERVLIILGAYIVPFAGIAFLWFMAAVRTVFLEQPGLARTVFAPMQVVAGALFVATSFVGAAAVAAASTRIGFFDSEADVDPDALRTLPGLAAAVFYIFAIRMAGVFVATTTRLGRGIMPRWLAVLGYAFAAVLLLTIAFINATALIFPAWVLILSAWLLAVPGRGRVSTP